VRLAEVRKAAAAAVGILGQVIVLGLVPDEYLPWANVIVAVATMFGVYFVPKNAPSQHDGDHEAGRIEDRGI
jgi:hypothetical protein